MNLKSSNRGNRCKAASKLLKISAKIRTFDPLVKRSKDHGLRILNVEMTRKNSG